ncbi:MAG: M48 family metalloprotease [Deltaproteobacteria bacterium]
MLLALLFSLDLAELTRTTAADEPRDDGSQVSFTPDERKCIDEGALWGPREKRNGSRVEAYGNAYQWLVARTPLPVDEEIRRAAVKDEELRSKFKSAAAPQLAAAVFAQLVEALPVRMRPKEYEFALTVIEQAEPEAFSLGAGRVYVGSSFLQSALGENPSGQDQLAFVLAHQLGHLSLGHARRVYQRLWLKEQLKSDVEGKRKKRRLKRESYSRSEEKEAADPAAEDEAIKRTIEALAGAGAMLEYVYSRQEQYEADLFAIHLCRNAGFDVENCLDALRRRAVAEDASLRRAAPPRQGIPPVEPDVQPPTTGEALTLANDPTAMHRLRRLRLELDGLIYGDAFGLFEFDPRTRSVKRAADHAVPGDARVVVCIHGMESNLKVYLPLMNRLGADPSGVAFRILGFQYPNDESLARSGKFLKREVQRVCAAPEHVDFVCHSAGGLVFRHYAEVEGGGFHHAYFQGTPHHGSDLAALRSLLEATQFIGDLKLGYDVALQHAILDGHGQMSDDLQPDSLFLRHLNAPRDNLSRDRYVIYRGQASSRTRALLMKTAVEAGRRSLERLLRNEETTASKFARAGLDKLVVPAEIANGDMAVTLESATLDGVEAVHTYPLHHTELPRNPDVIEHLAKLLVDE